MRKLKSRKPLLILLVIVVGAIVLWLSLDKLTRCSFVYGKNICNFYAVRDFPNPSSSDFEMLMNLCRQMEDVPKKDSCFYNLAEKFRYINTTLAKEACAGIEEFEGTVKKSDCFVGLL